MELPAVVVEQIKTVVKQELQQLLVAVELTLLAVLVQQEIRVAQRHHPFLTTVRTCKAAHHVTKQTQKAAAAAVVVITAVVVELIKPQAADQKMVAAAVARAILIQLVEH
jgi:hypothetical protein